SLMAQAVLELPVARDCRKRFCLRFLLVGVGPKSSHLLQSRTPKTFAEQNLSKKISAMCDLNYTAFESEFLSLLRHSNAANRCVVRLASFLCQATQRKEKERSKEPCLIESFILPSRPSLSSCRAQPPTLRPVAGVAVVAVVDQAVPRRAFARTSLVPRAAGAI